MAAATADWFTASSSSIGPGDVCPDPRLKPLVATPSPAEPPNPEGRPGRPEQKPAEPTPAPAPEQKPAVQPPAPVPAPAPAPGVTRPGLGGALAGGGAAVTVPAVVGGLTTVDHTVAPGDTFYALSSKYYTTVEEIQQANPGVNPEALQIGQAIKIGKKTTPYTIAAGDTFYGLVQAGKASSVEALQAWNAGVNPEALSIGQQINLA